MLSGGEVRFCHGGVVVRHGSFVAVESRGSTRVVFAALTNCNGGRVDEWVLLLLLMLYHVAFRIPLHGTRYVE
jgi:hypothetical protein